MLKNYLYNLILESMRDLRSKEKNTGSVIKNVLANALIMQEKGLKEQAINFFEKTKKLAVRHEQWGTLLDLLLMESKAMPQKPDLKDWKNLKMEIQSLFEKTGNLTGYDKIRHHMNLVIRKFGAAMRHGKQNRILKTLKEHTLMKDENKALSVSAKISYYWNLSSLYLLQHNYKDYHAVLIDYIHFIESNYSLIRSPDNVLIAALSNCFSIQSFLNKYKEAYETQRKHYALLQKKSNVTSENWIHFYLNETQYYLVTGEFEKGILLCTEIEKKIPSLNNPGAYDFKKNDIHQINNIALCFNIACLYFGNKDYRNALSWLNHIIRQPKISSHEQIQSFTKIVVILIHYELNTPDILEYLIISAYRYLLKRKLLYKFEESLLRFFRKLSKITPNQKQLFKAFEEFKNELVQITKDPEEKKALMYFDLISWMESKIENRPFAEIVKRKSEA